MTKAKSPTEFDYDSLQDPESIGTYLDALSKGFNSGRLLFCAGKHEMLLHPQGLLKFAVSAKRKDGQVKLNLDVSWKERKRKKTEEKLVIRSNGAED
jgi:amphi-Trp domain-containing protein